MSFRELIVFQAQVAERLEHYDDMFDFLTELGSIDSDLTAQERKLFSVFFFEFHHLTPLWIFAFFA